MKFHLLLSFFSLLITGAINGQNSQSSSAQLFGNAFSAVAPLKQAVTYSNPVIPGFWSDPSVCRVGNDYYLVNSTFEYFPGVPVFHSNDLVNWELIGYCIYRPSQLPGNLNIFATTIRYHEGTFYMITTNIGGRGNFYVTATNPAGPWSDPIFLPGVQGIDPDIFFDDDGRSYVTSSTFFLFEIDLKTGKLLSEGRKLWDGTGGRYPEGPHIYKKDGFYYLMIAEGGTEEAHSETIARSKYIWGPYTPNPSNPILTQCNAAGQNNPIQGTGHADIINAHDGSWWIVFHGYRSVGGTHHVLGRETCLAPVSWPVNGWPVVNGNGTVSPDMYCPVLPLKPFPKTPVRNDFNGDRLSQEWNYIRYPVTSDYSLTARKGYLRLMGSPETVSSSKSPTFTGRRTTSPKFTASTLLEFNPGKINEEAGLTLLNNGTHFDLTVKMSGTKRIASAKLMFGNIIHEAGSVTLKPGPVKLIIKCEGAEYSFLVTQGDQQPVELTKVMARYLSSETVGGFTGVYVGLWASGNGSTSASPADFDWFEYLPE